MPHIWSVYNRDHRLILGLSDEPGIFNFTKPTDEDVELVECEFATLQCYDLHAEPELLNLLFASSDVDEFLEALIGRGFKVVEGRPQPRKFARL